MKELKQIFKKINWLAVLQFVFVLALLTAPMLVQARGALPDNICDKTNGLNCNKVDDLNSLILTVINWILAITLAIDVLFMIFGGFLYITSAGNEDRAKKGKNTVVNAIIGLVIIVLAYFIAHLVASYFANLNGTA